MFFGIKSTILGFSPFPKFIRGPFLKNYHAKTIKDRNLFFVAFFIFCNVLNRKNKNELENYDKYGSLGGVALRPPPLGFSVTLIPLRVARIKFNFE